ncbi:hypothetical protein KCU67_g848, partial [Aureobasidium melanogenum]
MADPSGLHSDSQAPTDRGKRTAREPRYKTIAGSGPNSRPIYTTPAGERFAPVDRPCTPPGSTPDVKTFDYVSSDAGNKIPTAICYSAALYSQDYLTVVNQRTPLRTVTLLGGIIARAYALLEGLHFKEFDLTEDSAQDSTLLVIIGLLELIQARVGRGQLSAPEKVVVIKTLKKMNENKWQKVQRLLYTLLKHILGFEHIRPRSWMPFGDDAVLINDIDTRLLSLYNDEPMDVWTGSGLREPDPTLKLIVCLIELVYKGLKQGYRSRCLTSKQKEVVQEVRHLVSKHDWQSVERTLFDLFEDTMGCSTPCQNTALLEAAAAVYRDVYGKPPRKAADLLCILTNKVSQSAEKHETVAT